jgi:hypothetical protein
MIKKISQKISLALLSLIPIQAFAALDGIKGLLREFGSLLNLIIKIIFGLSLIFFFWGLAQFILHSGDPKTHEEGRNKMIWGVVALFVFISIYGILRWIGDLTGIRPNPSSNVYQELVPFP